MDDLSTSITTITWRQTLLSPIVLTTIFTDLKLHPFSSPVINSLLQLYIIVGFRLQISYKNTDDMSTSILMTSWHQTLLSPIVLTTIFTDFKLHPSSSPAINSLLQLYIIVGFRLQITYKNTDDVSTSISMTSWHQTLLSPIVLTTIFTDLKLHPSSPPVINSLLQLYIIVGF